MIKKTVLATAIATSLFSLPVFAYQAGDFIARVGAAGVFPTGDSDSLDVLPDANVEAQSAWSLGLSLSYMVTDNIGVGILGSWPFEHDVDPKGSDLKVRRAAIRLLPQSICLLLSQRSGISLRAAIFIHTWVWALTTLTFLMKIRMVH